MNTDDEPVNTSNFLDVLEVPIPTLPAKYAVPSVLIQALSTRVAPAAAIKA